MNIAIAGYGVEGKASYEYWNHDDNTLTIIDERESLENLPSGAITKLGRDAFEDLDEFDMIIRTASLAPRKLVTRSKVWSATNEFFEHCPAPIIGVTGTKGKGTTSSLITSILRKAGNTVHLVGNIGISALALLPQIKEDDIVVFEMSSFQLWDITKSPHVAVVLGIEPDHLNVHADFDEYVHAKANITKFQTEDDVLIVHATNQFSQQIARQSSATVYSYPSDGFVHIKDGMFFVDETKICSTNELQIPGAHNIENACAAISACWQFTQDIDAIHQGLASFEGLPHRIKLIRELDGVRYYDDSYSSAPAASVAAIRSFDEPKIVLLGGYDKGSSYDELANEIAGSETIKKIILYGQTRQKLEQACEKSGVGAGLIELCDTIDFNDIIMRAKYSAIDGDIVILSPGCSSFDMFKNFSDRGEQFIKMVERL